MEIKYNNNRSGNDPQIKNISTKTNINKDNNLLKITAEAYNYLTKVELVFDLKTDELTWTVKGKKEELFKKKYKNQEKFNIAKSNINKLDIKPDEGKRHVLRIELKNPKNAIFNFSFQDNNHQYISYKFYYLLQDKYENYKNEFQMLPIEQQKVICLLLNNKYLFQLNKKLIKCNYNNIEKNWQWIKYKYPEAININLGKNLIQLSRDEELIMLSQKQYNITKLINSDSNIYNSYKTEKNIRNENFWKEFIDRQTGNKTYIAGGFKPISCDDDNKQHYQKEKIKNIIFEYLEKDKYYYDCYETNYLYYNNDMNNEQEKLKEKIKLLNDYSINKIKDNNYFSYSSVCINAYNKKKEIKNKINTKILKYSNMVEENIEINFNNSNNFIKRLKKEELLNKIKNMENEYNYEKNINDNYYSPMKIINEENYNYYKLAKFDPSVIPVRGIINSFLLNYIYLIKDLAFFQKIAFAEIEKKEEEKSPEEKKIEQELKLAPFNKEIRNIYEKLKKNMQNNNLGDSKKVINYLLENVEKTIERLIYK